MVTTAPTYRMQGSVSVHVDAPPARVWELVGDIRRMGEWSPETRRVELLGGATEPGVGVRFRGHNRRGVLQRWSTRPVIRTYEPERELAFVLGTRGHDFVTWRYVLEPDGDGTVLTESFTARGYMLYGLLRPRRRERQLVEGMRVTLDRIKRAVELGAGAHPLGEQVGDVVA